MDMDAHLWCKIKSLLMKTRAYNKLVLHKPHGLRRMDRKYRALALQWIYTSRKPYDSTACIFMPCWEQVNGLCNAKKLHKSPNMNGKQSQLSVTVVQNTWSVKAVDEESKDEPCKFHRARTLHLPWNDVSCNARLSPLFGLPESIPGIIASSCLGMAAASCIPATPINYRV